MADKRKRIVISVQDDFSRQLRDLANQMDKAGNSAAKLNQAGQATGKSWQQSSRDFYFAAQNAKSLYNAFTGVFKAAEGLAVMGREAKNADIALTALAGSGAAADQWTAAIQRGMAGTVTGAEAARQAYQLMRFELAKTPEEAEKFARTIAIISKANPQLGDTGEAISQISLAISNMSYMRLDQLGLRAGTIREEVARLRKEFKGMSEEDAFSTAVMEGLKEQADMIGSSILEAGNATDRLNVRLKELKTDVGFKIAEGFEAAAGAMEGFIAVSQEGKQGMFANEAIKQGTGLDPMEYVAKGAYLISVLENYATGPSAPRQPNTAALGQHGQMLPMMGGVLGDFSSTYWEDYYAAQTKAMERFKQQEKEKFDIQEFYRRKSELNEEQATGLRKQRLIDMFAGQQQEQELFQERALRASIASRRTITRAEGFQGDLPTGQHGQLIPMGAMPGMYAGGAGTMGAGADYWAQYYGAQQKSRQGPPGGVASVFPVKEGNEWSNTLAAIAAQQEAVNKETTVFNSLAELFGQVTGGIPVEVYSDMAAALSEAGMAQEDINAALDDYEHATGLATDASDLYGQYVDTLSQKMAEGKVKQEDFTAAMLAMSNASPAVYEAMGKIGEGIKSFVSDPMGAIGGLFAGGGEGEKGEKKKGPFADLGIDELLPKIQEVDTLLTERPTAWAESIGTWQNLTTGQFGSFADSSVAAFDRIATEGIDRLDGRVIHVTIEGSIQTPGGPDATRGSGTETPMLPHLQHGGWLEGGKIGRVTEDNVPELFAVGGRQYVMAPRGGGAVIPMREITPAALAGGGGGGEQSSHVYLDGKELQHSWVRHRVMQNRAT